MFGNFFKNPYKTRKGFLKSRDSESLSDATLFIYPTGVCVVCGVHSSYEASPQGTLESATVFDIISNNPHSQYIQFLCIE